MLKWLMQSIGISSDVTQRLGDVQWYWSRPLVLWIGVALLLPLAWYVVRRQRRNLPHVAPLLRGLLSFCRVAVLALLVFVLAGPYLRVSEEVTSKPVLAIVVDESGSMALPAGPFDADRQLPMAKVAGLVDDQGKLSAEARKELDQLARLEMAQRALAKLDEAAGRELNDRFDVRRYRVARQVRDAASSAAKADTTETDLGLALQRAVDDSAGRQLAGVVLLTDGRWTTGADPVRVIAPTGSGGPSGSLAPVFTVPIGGVQPAADVAVLDVLAPTQVAQGDSAVVMASIESQGLDGKTVEVRLLDDAGAVLDRKPLVLSGRERQTVELTLEGKKTGTMPLTVEVTAVAEERIAANNRMTTTVTVDPQQLRLLYVEGSPRWDFRFLDHSLRRDRGIAATIVMEAEPAPSAEEGKKDEKKGEEEIRGIGDAHPAASGASSGLPQDAAGFKAYRVVLLGDVSPRLLTPKVQRELALAVREEGVGLIIQCGPQHMPHDYLSGPLGLLLPLEMADGRGVNAAAYAPFQMEVTATGSIHPVFRLYDQATRNRQVWGRMPPFYWAISPSKARPGATVLAEYVDRSGGAARYPLMAAQFAGQGRVLLIGLDSTFRWRRNIGTHLFYRYWGQAIRYVGESDVQRGEEGNWLEVYPQRAEPGERVNLDLYAVDAQGQPVRDPQVTLRVSGKDYVDGVTATSVGQPGRFRATWLAQDLGAFRFTYADPRGRSVHATLTVAGADRELRQPTVDRTFLASLAGVSGGAMLEPDQLDQLPQRLVGEAQTVTRVHEDEVWDNWLVLVLLVGIYCLDVGVRRILGLT